MASVNITAVNVLDNPAPFTNPLQFEIHYECLNDLQEDLEWKLVYVGSAEDEKHDQVLDCVMVGPVVQGKFKFVFQADAPNPDSIPSSDLVGVTVVLLTCSYKDSEFLRVGYYVNVEYDDEETKENPPDKPIVAKLQRNILDNKPRVTRFANTFDEPPAEETEAGGDMAEGGDDGDEGFAIDDLAEEEGLAGNGNEAAGGDDMDEEC